MPQTPEIITPQAVAATLGRHIGLYRHRAPHYQAVMLSALRALWQDIIRVCSISAGGRA